MKKTFHPSAGRGHVNHGWLNSHHSFSFGRWYDEDKLHFGALRVLNDDSVRGGAGFGTHPHDNMEIVSIPLKGALQHKDSTGTNGIIQTGDVQIMSAGSGIAHSEYNASPTEQVDFLQIWVFPKTANIKPRYEQKAFAEEDRVNRWQTVVNPEGRGEGVATNQDAWFSRTHLTAGTTIAYPLHQPGNGVYFFVINGQGSVEDQALDSRDAVGIAETSTIAVKAVSDMEILAIEVPMILPGE